MLLKPIALGSVNGHTDVDTTTDTPEVGSALFWDGTNFVPDRRSSSRLDVANTTTSTTFQNYLTHTMRASDPAGTYEIEMCYQWNHDDTGNDFEGRIILNGDTANPIMFHKQEPKDAAGGDPSGTTQRYWLKFADELVLPAGANTFDIEFRTDTGGAESTIFQAFITVRRVA